MSPGAGGDDGRRSAPSRAHAWPPTHAGHRGRSRRGRSHRGEVTEPRPSGPAARASRGRGGARDSRKPRKGGAKGRGGLSSRRPKPALLVLDGSRAPLSGAPLPVPFKGPRGAPEERESERGKEREGRAREGRGRRVGGDSRWKGRRRREGRAPASRDRDAPFFRRPF